MLEPRLRLQLPASPGDRQWPSYSPSFSSARKGFTEMSLGLHSDTGEVRPQGSPGGTAEGADPAESRGT